MFLDIGVFEWQPILEAKATAVWLDKNYRPIRIPADIKSKFVKFIRNEDSWCIFQMNIWLIDHCKS